MKRGAFLVFALLYVGVAVAQKQVEITPDQRVVESYGHEFIDNLQNTNTDRIDYLNFYVEHSWYLAEIPLRNDEKFPKVSDVINPKFAPTLTDQGFDVSNPNILPYNFKRFQETESVYRIDNTNQVIVFYPIEDFMNSYNQSRSTK